MDSQAPMRVFAEAATADDSVVDTTRLSTGDSADAPCPYTAHILLGHHHSRGRCGVLLLGNITMLCRVAVLVGFALLVLTVSVPAARVCGYDCGAQWDRLSSEPISIALAFGVLVDIALSMVALLGRLSLILVVVAFAALAVLVVFSEGVLLAQLCAPRRDRYKLLGRDGVLGGPACESSGRMRAMVV